ncbi:MAG: DUF4082 domain-containing protein [Ferruginibacter sp.]|nr:DUF4082 domain-containing protein [Ferruginibacter sp.]
MKQLLVISIAIILTGSACKKDDEKVRETVTETPLKTSIESKGIVDVTVINGIGPYIFGNKFYTSVDGKITKLGCRMPEMSDYIVTLWDFATKTSLAQATVTTTNADSFSYASISPVTIAASTRHVVPIFTINAAGVPKMYYHFYKGPTAINSIYPYTYGKVTIEAGLAITSGSAIIMPEYYAPLDLPYIRGVADFQFEYEKAP